MSNLYDKFMEISTEETFEEYHARSKSGEVLSSGLLRKFIVNPIEYFMLTNGMLDESNKLCFQHGREYHKFILEGEGAFLAGYDISDGPINPTYNKPYGRDSQKYQNWLAERERPVVNVDDFNNLKVMEESVRNHNEAKHLLSNGTPERVVRCEVGGVLCQVRIDYFNRDEKATDFKTCDDLTYFEYDYKKYNYDIQFIFYMMVLETALGVVPSFYAVASEKSPTARTGAWLCDYAPDRKAYVLGQILKFKKQRETGFESGFEELRVLT